MKLEVTKERAGYRRVAQRLNGGKNCGNCAYFSIKAKCAVVIGAISSDHVCDYWR